ncbi:MAG: hypothetical protein GXX96_32220 [Planctomycetaceae bacterium]|nr:hypothetical protein [Planctomycetaceae bacterium]
MARPVRVEFENAVYHVTARGHERITIYRDPADRQRFLETLEEAVDRFGLVVHAYCLLGTGGLDRSSGATTVCHSTPLTIPNSGKK